MKTEHFVLKPDGKIYWVKDMPENKCLDEPGYGLYKQALQSAIDNAVEVSNQEEIFERLHGIAYPLNLKTGTPYSLLCSVEMEQHIRAKGMEIEWTKIVKPKHYQPGEAWETKVTALVTFPESAFVASYQRDNKHYIESGNRTAERYTFYKSNRDGDADVFYNGHALPNLPYNVAEELCTAANNHYKLTQQCEALQSENERLKAMLKICRLEIKTAYDLDGIKDDRILKHIDSLLNPKE
jgi:hypothetical protein